MSESATNMVTTMSRQVVEAITTDGNFLVFSTLGLLAISGALLNDWTWEREELAGLPQVRDQSGRRFAYKLLSGGQFVEVYLPTGRRVAHRVTPRASLDPTQLEAEVFAIITDNYPATT